MAVNALLRGLGIVELAVSAGNEGLSLSYLAEKLGVANSTAHNLVRTLQDAGYLRKVSKGVYCAGWKLDSIARGNLLDISDNAGVRDEVSRLCDCVGEDIVLAGLTAGRRRIIMNKKASQLIAISGSAGDGAHLRMWSAATGRILSAYCGNEELEGIVEDIGLPGDDWDGVADFNDLKDKLTHIKECGFAEITDTEICSIAVAVFDCDGEIAAALGCAVPAFRYSEEHRESILYELRESAKNISVLL